MTIGWIYVIVFGSMILAAIVLVFILSRRLKKLGSIELVQGKLENTDLSIAQAIKHLKITNQWSGQDERK